MGSRGARSAALAALPAVLASEILRELASGLAG
jgi:hypothetical protein